MLSAETKPSQHPEAAFAIGRTLTLVDAAGKVTRQFQFPANTQNFALSPDQSQMVVVRGHLQNGGPLDLVNLHTQTVSRLLTRPFYFRQLDKGEVEVYADPHFSPDGKSVVFAVHSNQPGDGNDAIDGSGPLAVMDLATRKVKVLKATEKIDQYPCYTNSPKWSPDGKMILFACEVGAFLTDATGTSLKAVSIEADKEGDTVAVNWVGDNCILIFEFKDGPVPGPDRWEDLRLYNLKTSKTLSQRQVFSVPFESLNSLSEATDRTILRRYFTGAHGVILETSGSTWKFPSDVPIHLLDGWKQNEVPWDCR